MELANSSVILKSSEMQSLAFCIVSTQAGLRQGSEQRAVAVISPPSGRLGRDGSQNSAACLMDLRVRVFVFGRGRQDTFNVQAFTGFIYPKMTGTMNSTLIEEPGKRLTK